MIPDMLLKQFHEFCFPVALEDDVVIADRVLEEIFCGLFVGEADELLGAAEVRSLAVFY